jgi:hypothetical protein
MVTTFKMARVRFLQGSDGHGRVRIRERDAREASWRNLGRWGVPFLLDQDVVTTRLA